MQIIFGRQNAESLKDKYTILELETFVVGEKILETYCCIGSDNVNLTEYPTIESSIQNHNKLVQYIKDKNYDACANLIPDLLGKFGGELDSFYEEILKRNKS